MTETFLYFLATIICITVVASVNIATKCRHKWEKVDEWKRTKQEESIYKVRDSRGNVCSAFLNTEYVVQQDRCTKCGEVRYHNINHREWYGS